MFFFFFFNDTASTEIYTRSIVGSVRCVQETGTAFRRKLIQDRMSLFRTLLSRFSSSSGQRFQKALPELRAQFTQIGLYLSLTLTFLSPHVLCVDTCLLYTSPSPRDLSTSRMPSSA
eukprot:TRINITY_DN20545_c0_g2_i1.p1 TRINITY_DN20545_c0_g2~~TRINITY_DN20545_c0_g2_i1.p1  ORF type:complete len:117 (+),score=21.59 TRINITY_DN20545_c0_g2_i1:64-414(+)